MVALVTAVSMTTTHQYARTSSVMIEIINMQTGARPTMPYDFKIDRTSPVGNDVTIKQAGSRDKACDQYQRRFDNILSQRPENMHPDDLAFMRYIVLMIQRHVEHGRLRLFCWCAPERCHGESIKRYIAWMQPAGFTRGK